MAAYSRVYDSCHLHADCQEPGSAPGPYARQSSTGTTGYSFTFSRPLSSDKNATGALRFFVDERGSRRHQISRRFDVAFWRVVVSRRFTGVFLAWPIIGKNDVIHKTGST